MIFFLLVVTILCVDDSSDTTVSYCYPSCVNGYCYDGYCSCEYGWSGSDCSYRECYSNCENGGWCVDIDNCECPNGYHGSTCAEYIGEEFKIMNDGKTVILPYSVGFNYLSYGYEQRFYCTDVIQNSEEVFGYYPDTQCYFSCMEQSEFESQFYGGGDGGYDCDSNIWGDCDEWGDDEFHLLKKDEDAARKFVPEACYTSTLLVIEMSEVPWDFYDNGYKRVEITPYTSYYPNREVVEIDFLPEKPDEYDPYPPVPIEAVAFIAPFLFLPVFFFAFIVLVFCLLPFCILFCCLSLIVVLLFTLILLVLCRAGGCSCSPKKDTNTTFQRVELKPAPRPVVIPVPQMNQQVQRIPESGNNPPPIQPIVGSINQQQRTDVKYVYPTSNQSVDENLKDIQ